MTLKGFFLCFWGCKFLPLVILILQKVCRGYLVRQWVQKRMLSVVQIQAAVRTIIARLRYHRLLIEVRSS